MSDQPEIKLHVLPPSHPCMTAEAALRFKGIEFEKVSLIPGQQQEPMAAVYGEGNTTVPGMQLGDQETVHGSTAICARLEELKPEPSLYPEPIADQIRDAELWGDADLQDLGRRLPWGVLHFRPEAMGSFAGGDSLDPAGTDFALKLLRGTWKYHSISMAQLGEDLTRLPAMVAEVERLAREGIIGGDEPNAADLQIGATIRVLLTIRDLDPVLAGTAAAGIANRHFPDYPGEVPVGAFPAGWVKTA